VQPAQRLGRRRPCGHHDLPVEPVRRRPTVEPTPQRLQQVGVHDRGDHREPGGRAQVERVAAPDHDRVGPDRLAVEDRRPRRRQRHREPVAAAAQVAALAQRAVAVLAHQAQPGQLNVLQPARERPGRQLLVLEPPVGLGACQRVDVAGEHLPVPAAGGGQRLGADGFGGRRHGGGFPAM